MDLSETVACIRRLEAQVAALVDAVAQRDAENARLRERIALQDRLIQDLVRRQYGRRNERYIDELGQLRLDLSGVGLAAIPQAAAADTSAVATLPDAEDAPCEGKSRARQRGRRDLSAEFPDLVVEEVVIELPEAERFDADGTPLVAMGSETSERLVWEPNKPRIRRTIRVRYGRSDTGEKVAIAPPPPAIVDRGILADETIHHGVISHVLDGLPWNRLEVMSARQGPRIGRSLWVTVFAAWASLILPLAAAIRDEILRSPVIGADSTRFNQQDARRRRCCAVTALWGITDGCQAAYHWTPDERHARAQELLGGYTGILVRDEWKGWAALERSETPPAVQAGCLAHARRRFEPLAEVDADAALMMRLYRDLYRVEYAAAAATGPDDDPTVVRWQFRQQQSLPILAQLRAQAEAIARATTPASALGKAAAYQLDHWHELTCFVTDGRIWLDNNRTENVLRPVAVLRKNRLFLGDTPEAGPRLATALTVLISCRQMGLEPHAYLAEVTPVLFAHRHASRDGGTLPDLSDWTPRSVADRRSADQSVAG